MDSLQSPPEESTGKTMIIATARKWSLAAIGIISVGLAAIGVFVPLLPTTPFLLLAAACFIRSSGRLYNWLVTHRWFGPHIRNYREHKAVALKVKVSTLGLLWGTIGYAAFGALDSWPPRILLLLVAGCVTAHVLSLKTLD